MTVLFWFCAGAMAYVYVGYPVLLFLVSRVFDRRVADQWGRFSARRNVSPVDVLMAEIARATESGS